MGESKRGTLLTTIAITVGPAIVLTHRRAELA